MSFVFKTLCQLILIAFSDAKETFAKLIENEKLILFTKDFFKLSPLKLSFIYT